MTTLSSPRAILVSTALALLAVSPTSHGQVPGDRWLPVETQANALTGSHRWSAAAAVLLKDLETRCKSTSGRDAAREGAFAEYLTARLDDTAWGTVDPLRLRRRLTQLATSPLAKSSPTLRSLLLTCALRLGGYEQDVAGRNGLAADLGILTDWMLVGPFDNERGAGFGIAKGPETRFEPNRSYPGKKRDVRWRRLPPVPVDGRINIGAMVRPNQQVFCYLATCVMASEEGDALLHLGSSEGFEVHLNGARLAGAPVHRTCGFDQNRVLLPLRQGPNYLVLKLLTETGDLECLARLTDLGGQRLKDVNSTTENASLLRSLTTTPRRSEANLTLNVLGGRSVFQAVEGQPFAPIDGYRRAVLLRYYGALDAKDNRTTALLTRVTESLPKDATARFLLAASRSRGSQNAADREENRRRHDYQRILEDHPEHVRTMLALAQLDASSIGVTEQSRRLLRTALALQPRNPSLLLHLARQHRRESLVALEHQALRAATQPDEDGNVFLFALRGFGRAKATRQQHPEARRHLTTLIKFENSIQDRLALARARMDAGQREQAIEILEATRRHHPLEATPFYRLARLFEAEQNYPAALDVLQELLTVCPENDSAWVETARIHGMMGRAEKQREALRTAVSLNPNRKKDRRLLEFLSAGAQPFFAAEVIDEKAILAAARDQIGALDASSNHSHDYLLRQRVVRAYRNGTTSTYQHEIVRIRNEAGIRAFTRIDVPHYWGEQRARLLQVTIHKRDGTRRRPRLRGSSAQLPTLREGDIIDYRYRVDDTAPSFFGDMLGFEHIFGGRVQPIADQRLTLILDPGRRYRLQTAHGAPAPQKSKPTPDGGQIWKFAMRDLPGTTAEKSQPRGTESQPLVRVTTFADWNAFSGWWWNLIKDQQRVSSPIRDKVAELTAGITSKREQIEAIYRFVTTEIRYKAWEFGVHGYKPYSTPVIFERRHGDCKDKSLLLNCMLSVLGIPAHPVLIRADTPRSRDDLSLPLVNHFNHCISFVEATDETPAMYLDGTATYHPLDTLPAMDWGAEVLVVRGSKATVQKIPWPDPAANQQQSEAQITLRPNGDADVRLRMRPRGNQAVWLRESLGNEPAKRKQRLADGLRREFGTIQLESVEASNLLDLAQPVEIQAQFEVRGHATLRGSDLVLPSTTAPVSLARFAVTAKRTTPLLLGTPRRFATTTTYALPPGYSAVDLPKNVARAVPAARFSLTWKLVDGRLEIERQLEVLKDRVNPTEYAAFREFSAAVDEASERAILLQNQSKKEAR